MTGVGQFPLVWLHFGFGCKKSPECANCDAGVVKDFSPSLAELKPEEVFSPHWLITPDHPLESHDGVVADSSCPCCCWRSCWFCWCCSCFRSLQQLSEEIKSLCIQKVKGRWKAPVECTKERRNADQPPSASFSPSHQKGNTSPVLTPLHLSLGLLITEWNWLCPNKKAWMALQTGFYTISSNSGVICSDGVHGAGPPLMRL